jgi:hypothetical protein
MINLTLKQVFEAGFIQGMLTRTEQESYAVLGKSDVTTQIIEKQVFEDFAKKSPQVAAQYKETMRILFGSA